MNCQEFEQLIDAHLDGELAGTIRLEFDAHRVHCTRCEHAVTLLEAVATVASTRPPAPALSDDFTARVMARVAAPAPTLRTVKYRGTRIALVAGGLFQAAAVLLITFVLREPAGIPVETSPEKIDLASVTPNALQKYIYDLSARELAAQGDFGAQFLELKRAAMNINLTGDVLVDPIGILQAVLPVNPAEPEPTGANQYSF